MHILHIQEKTMKKTCFFGVFYKTLCSNCGQKTFFEKNAKKRFAHNYYGEVCQNHEKKCAFEDSFARIWLKVIFTKKRFCPQLLLGNISKNDQKFCFMHANDEKVISQKLSNFMKYQIFRTPKNSRTPKKKTYRVTPIKSQNLDPFFRLLQWGNVKKDVFFIFW